MTLADNYEHRAFNGLAIVTGAAALAAVVLLTVSLGCMSHATNDVTPTFGTFDRSLSVSESARM